MPDLTPVKFVRYPDGYGLIRNRRGHWVSLDSEAAEAVADLEADLRATRRQRDLAIAHDQQPYSTADAYEAACAALHKHRERADVAEAQRDQLREHILDIDAHATPYGDVPDEPGWVGTYLVTAGALHRALGKIGHSAPKCNAEAQCDRYQAVVDKAWAVVQVPLVPQGWPDGLDQALTDLLFALDDLVQEPSNG